MRRHIRMTFLALIVAQAAHSVEECAFGLWGALPSRLALGASVDARAVGFALINIILVAFGVWCYAARVRKGYASATRWMWVWGAAEFINGLAHTTMALRRGGYFPGVATAPVLLVLAVLMAAQLAREGRARGVGAQPD